ncbi:TetR family transcriptional regulator [Sphaerisporangium siamense]|uniref:AcrR family transcriptional regulator n=1 Tax=Sphaerisporangium siamense TaxID=795645 RepID=A0A7W7D1V9_9ACTN|nr:TetR-like C-terminal domain-containing protein [Sphaerisporangium siamense]MBB4698596.1 AcrR family transcriptional regulator [Sphaerisporangium siamense]GII85345.1 TetR family transcriptional regulator [Sphaerisporangium siamense]
MTAGSRPRSKRGSGEELREALLATTAALLDAGQDVESLSVRTVTSATGVSPTALYLHFADLTELVRTLKVRIMRELSARLRAAAEPHPGDVRARLRAMARAYLRFAEEHPGHYAAVFHVGPPRTGAAPPDEVIRAGFEAFQPLQDAVAEALRERSGRETTPEQAFEVTCGLWFGLHGRAHLGAAMPWLTLPAEDAYVDRLVRGEVG